MIKVSCGIIGRSPSRKVIILPSLVAIGTLVIEIRSLSRYATILASFVAIDTVLVEI